MMKLHNERGETLIEVLASIIIGSLSVALMFGCIMASTKMDEDARALDEKHYDGLTVADVKDAVPVSDAPEESGDAEDPEVSGDSDDSEGPRVMIKRGGSTVYLDITVYEGAEMYSYSRSGSVEGVGDSTDEEGNP